MQTFLYCWRSITMTLSVLFLILPCNAFGHLGSAMKAGSGALTKIAFGDKIFFCTIPNQGEVKPPVLLNHIRVSREPQPHPRRVFNSDDFEGASDPLRIKSPSYQHKILQFHSNGQTSSGSHDFYPLKLITNQYPSTNSMPIYPVASKFGKVDSSRLVGSTSTGSAYENDDDDGDDSWESYSSRWEPNILPEPEQPTFTPFIGARALTNIPLFFKHLRENIHSIYDKQRDSAAANNDETEGAAQRKEEDVDKASETRDIKIATPTRRGYSSNSQPEPSPLPDNHLDAADITSRDYRASNLYTLGTRMSERGNAELDEEAKELLHFLGHGKPEFSKANNYNPAWLFTNLGLGKRKRSSSDGWNLLYNELPGLLRSSEEKQ